MRNSTIRLLLSMLVCMWSTVSMAQTKTTITGMVKDASGAPLSGVTVKIKGINAGGSISDESGNFSIKAAPDAILVFSSVGYASKEFMLNGTSAPSIQLERNSKALTEVVVTGFGVKKDTRKLAYSITEIKGSEVVAANNSNVGDALQGKVAGLSISQGTGGPSSSSRIQIRGNARLGGNTSLNPGNTEPLIVLDGILIEPGTTGADSWGTGADFGNIIKDLNPDDYESITVLKGSAASALYGSKALNGVLLITTKKGRARKGVGVTYNQTASMDKAYSMPTLQNEFGGGLSPTFKKDAQGNDVVDQSASLFFAPNGGYSYGPKFDGHLVKDLDGRMVPWVANNPLKDFYRTGEFINTNVAAEGGNENSNIRVSYTNLYNTSVTPNNSLRKNSFALHGLQKLGNIVTLDASVNYSSVKILNPSQQGGGGQSQGFGLANNPISNFLGLSSRNAPISYYKNNYIDKINGGVKSTPSSDPYFLATTWWPIFQNNLSRKEDVLLANLDVTVKITPWLNFLLRTNVQNFNYTTENKMNGPGAGFSNGSYELDQSNYKNTRVQALLTANKSIAKDLVLSASIGAEQFNNLGGPSTIAKTNGGLNVPGGYFIANSTNPYTFTQGYNPTYRADGAYLYGDLTWKEMLTLNFSLRNDWSSSLTYADGHGDYTYAYPSVGLAWVFTELPMFKNSNSILSFGKLRASVGWTGYSAEPWVTNNTGYYGSVGTFNNPSNANQILNSYTDGNNNYNTTLGNLHLKNEIAREIEFGTDLRFFNNRLGLDVAYYKKNSKNQILPLPADEESGISNRTINAGNIQNSGIEVLLTANPVKTKDFNWNMSVNMTHNSNKVIALYPGVVNYQLQLAFGNDVTAYAIAGRDYGIVNTGYAFASYASKGTNTSLNGQPVIGKANGATGGNLTYVRSKDYDGTNKDLGTITPTLLWGTVQNFSYKNFSFMFQIDSKVGGLMASATDQYGSTTGSLKSSLFGRNAAHGGVSYTDKNGVSHDDGIIPKGVIADGTISPYNNTNVGGQTYADAVKAGNLLPVPAYAYYENLTQWSTGIRAYSIFDNSWVAVRQVSVGYNLPSSIYKKAHLNGLRFSLTGRNLFYIYKNAHNGINPEGLYNNQAGAFAEGGGLPLVRSMGATLNASF